MKRIKGFCKNIKEGIKKLNNKGKEYYNRNFGDTKGSLSWIAILLPCILGGIVCAESFEKEALAFLLGAGFTAIVILSVVWISDKVLKLLVKGGIRNIINVIVIVSTILSCIAMGNIGEEVIGNVVGIILSLTLILFGKSLWAVVKNKVHTPTVWITLVLCGMVLLGTGTLLYSEGYEDDYIEEYLEFSEFNDKLAATDDFKDLKKQGEYTVEELEYSPYKKGRINSSTVDLSFFVEEEKGPKKWYRKLMQKFDLKTAPIAGKVWYPKEKSNCPVLFIAHGNHSILSESYLGYAYLGEYLASNGYVVVSVDENVLNMRQNENDARAVLLLENMKKLKAFNLNSDTPLYGKMDYEKIAIAGHSRGGEMVATAYLFNAYNSYPENGMRKFNYHFNIQSILAIAPTVNQYMPADHAVLLENVNYLVLHGANDQDVMSFMGNTQYEHTIFEENSGYLKSSLYIAGANHGQFNSKWGKYDRSNPAAPWLNVANFISEEEQQEILKLYARVFLDQTLLQKDSYADLLTNYEKYRKFLPKTIYVQQSQAADFTCISNFEEDSDLTSATMENATIKAYRMKHWTEEMSQFSNGGKRENHVLMVDWKDTKEAYIEFSLQGVNLDKKSLQYDICDMMEYDGEEKTEARALYTKVVLTDAEGNKASLSTKGYSTVYPALPIKLSKMQYLLDEREYKRQYQTVSLPISDFKAEGASFDNKRIENVVFYFDAEEKGDVSLDNIGFSNH